MTSQPSVNIAEIGGAEVISSQGLPTRLTSAQDDVLMDIAVSLRVIIALLANDSNQTIDDLRADASGAVPTME